MSDGRLLVFAVDDAMGAGELAEMKDQIAEAIRCKGMTALILPKGMRPVPDRSADCLPDDYENPDGEMETASGVRFNLRDPDPADVRIGDIAHHLARQCRYNGACRGFLSVAQHSVVVARILDDRYGDMRLSLLGLLHDAHEAYTGDIVRGLKPLLPALREVEARVQAAVLAGLGVTPPTEGESRLVKSVDMDHFRMEVAAQMPSGNDGDRMDWWAPGGAEAEFMAAWEYYCARI